MVTALTQRVRQSPSRLMLTGAASLLAAGLLGGTTAAAASAPSWRLASIQAVREAGGALNAVSCPSPQACAAVGEFSVKTNFTMAPLGASWNGTSWARQPMPAPAGASELNMTGESCPSATACAAVGTINEYFAPAPVAERWDGSQWTIQSVKVPSKGLTASLNTVACWSATGCLAVGQLRHGEAGTGTAMAAQWNGTAWIAQRLPSSHGYDLSGISCVSATACVAVGHHGRRPLAEGWNGSAWTVQTMARTGSALSAVSCTSAQACIAVGNTTRMITGHVSVLAERWDGTSWTVVPTPRPGNASLKAVSCSSAQACTAVGTRAVGTRAVGTRVGGGLAERWNGQKWTIQPAGAPAGATLSGVSCPSSRDCAAVGVAAGKTLAEHWDGAHWAVQPAPDGSVGVYAPLSAVSCASAAACTVVGTFTDVAGGQRPLAEHWNGTSWAIQSVSGEGRISGVSCPAAAYCAAVGDSGDHPQAQAWAGTSWTSQPIRAITGARSATLVAVSCASATACAAVGSYTDRPGHSSPLAERWNGTAWARQALPVVSASRTATLLGVSCPSARACTAVGHYFDRAQHRWRMLAEAWNGSAWAIQPAPTPTGHGDDFYTPALTAVSCLSPTACTAVGRFADLTVAEHWNGQHWAIQSTPNPSTNESVLFGVSCPSAAACIAVGTQYDTGTDTTTSLAEGYDGTTWTAQTTPGPPKDGSAYLFGVSCPSASDCFAVGDADATLVEHYS
jgi:hypothetical protein